MVHDEHAHEVFQELLDVRHAALFHPDRPRRSQSANTYSPISFSAPGSVIPVMLVSLKHIPPMYSSPFGSAMFSKFRQLLKASYSILFSVDGSKTLSSALPSKTPRYS